MKYLKERDSLLWLLVGWLLLTRLGQHGNPRIEGEIEIIKTLGVSPLLPLHLNHPERERNRGKLSSTINEADNYYCFY